MDIKGIDGGNNPYAVDRAKDSDRSGRAEAVPARDRLELSPDAKRIASLAQTANALPEIRQERVAELTEAIRQGVHSVEPGALARSIVEFEDALR